MTGDINVIVFEYSYFAEEVPLLAQPIDTFDQCLAIVVSRVGFAGEDNLYRAMRIIQKSSEPLFVMKYERRTLVGSEAAGEPQRQRLGVEHTVYPSKFPVTFPMA